MLRVVATLVVLAVLGLMGALAFIYSGLYNVPATQQHTAPVYWVLNTALTRSVKRNAQDIQVPDLSDEAMIRRGLAHYQNRCLQCHGAPGLPPDDFAKGLTPVANRLVQTAREWQPAEIFWVVKHGIKMTGMPAWDYRLADEEIWAIVAFVMQMPRLSPIEYQAMVEDLAEAQDRSEQQALIRRSE